MTKLLTRRQNTFVTEYAKDGNATQAALRAGYAPSSAHQRGYELVRNSEVQQRLDELGVVGMNTLEDVAINGRNEIARVGAAKTMVELAYGKPKNRDSTTFGDITIVINKVKV